MNYDFLKQLCAVYGPAGEEQGIRDFLISYIEENSHSWATKPKLIYGDAFQDNLILIFGKPRTAIFAHIDTIGFTVRYNNNLVKLGGPRVKSGIKLWGEDSKGTVSGTLELLENDKPVLKSKRIVEPGTNLVFVQKFKETAKTVQSCYLDNRLGVFSALEVAKTLKDGAIVFSTYEEVGGGAVGYLGKFLQEEFGIRQALISDITWVTEGVPAGKGPAISQRDSGIPRRSYVKRIMQIAREANIPFQVEVENAGGSDGNQLQASPYPWDWCFVGAPEANVHTPEETVHKFDIENMVSLYCELMDKL